MSQFVGRKQVDMAAGARHDFFLLAIPDGDTSATLEGHDHDQLARIGFVCVPYAVKIGKRLPHFDAGERLGGELHDLDQPLVEGSDHGWCRRIPNVSVAMVAKLATKCVPAFYSEALGRKGKRERMRCPPGVIHRLQQFPNQGVIDATRGETAGPAPGLGKRGVFLGQNRT